VKEHKYKLSSLTSTSNDGRHTKPHITTEEPQIHRSRDGHLAEYNGLASCFLAHIPILKKSVEPAPRNDADELFEGIRRALARSGRKKFTAEESMIPS
jgi:hypothetical protein